MKPRVGISGYPRMVETVLGPTLLHTASRFYVDSVVRAGGVPLVLPVLADGDVPALVAAVDAIVVTGGGDIDPARYGADRAAETVYVDPVRDEFDVRLLREALDRGVPVLATCRGMQVVNVVLGGSLVQHVPALTGQEHRQYERWAEGVHAVDVAPDSRLAAALGTTRLLVNSLHHQAVCEPAPGLRAVAWAEDGTVEAVEAVEAVDAANRRLVAVQWHPELLEDDARHQGLFRQLVAAAG